LRDFEGKADTRQAWWRRPRAGTGRALKVRSYAGVDRLIGLLGLGHLRPNVPQLPEFRYLGHLARNLARPVFRGRLRPVANALSTRLGLSPAFRPNTNEQNHLATHRDAVLQPASRSDMPE
jgi:hypothetical protein